MRIAKLFGFLPRVGGRSAETVDGRSLALGAASGVPSTNWLRSESVIREAIVVSETVSDADMGIDDCLSCAARSGRDCQRCTLFLEAVGKISLETVFAPRAEQPPPLPEPETVAPVRVVPRRSLAAPARKPSLHPRESARQFVAYIRETGRTGQYASTDLRQAYYDFCDDFGRRPTGEQQLRAALLKVPGVSKEKPWARGANAKIERKVYWIIEPETVSETETEHETVALPKRLGALAQFPPIQKAA